MLLESDMALIENTTRAEYAAYLKSTMGQNKAIQNHFKKVDAMTEEQWAAHRANRIVDNTRFSASGTAQRLAKQIIGAH